MPRQKQIGARRHRCCPCPSAPAPNCWRSPRGLQPSPRSCAQRAPLAADAEIDAGLMSASGRSCRIACPGCCTEGILPGGFKVKRRAAAALHRDLTSPEAARDPLQVMDWVNLYALAVNEENAAGGRVVTAPPTARAGIVPAVLHYYHRFCPAPTNAGRDRLPAHRRGHRHPLQGKRQHLGAEVGCQGEVGVACSMAAGALAAVLGGTPEQVENAAEIGMEHHLGLTCDPVGGLVQIPIERNAIALGQGHQRGAHGAARRRQPPRQPRQGHQDHARDRTACATSGRRRRCAGRTPVAEVHLGVVAGRHARPIALAEGRAEAINWAFGSHGLPFRRVAGRQCRITGNSRAVNSSLIR